MNQEREIAGEMQQALDGYGKDEKQSPEQFERIDKEKTLAVEQGDSSKDDKEENKTNSTRKKPGSGGKSSTLPGRESTSEAWEKGGVHSHSGRKGREEENDQ